MRTSFPPATELTVTFIHCPENIRRQRTWQWLEEMVKAGRQAEIPPVVVVRDPDGFRLLVYDGNIRAAWARQNQYDLNMIIIVNENDWRDYLKDHQPLWFGITDFSELLKFLRMYAQYPKEGGYFPTEMEQQILAKQYRPEELKRWSATGMRPNPYGWFDDD